MISELWRRHGIVQRLLWRALVLYVILRVILTGVGVKLREVEIPSPTNPFGIVLFVSILGAMDIKRRHEGVLFANLGYSRLVLCGAFASVAAIGEILIALVGG